MLFLNQVSSLAARSNRALLTDAFSLLRCVSGAAKRER
jgi:hypothetical protein